MGFMLRLSLVGAATTAAVLFGSTAFATAGVTHSPTARGSAGSGASIAAAPSLGPTLYDQNDNDGGDGFTSMSGFDTQAADDFIVPATESWHVTSVFAPGSDVLTLSSVTVTLYRDSSGAPGAQVYTLTVPSGSFTDDPGYLEYPGGNLTIPIDATLTPGHYWLSVQGDGDRGYWYWEIRSVVSNTSAMWQNPNDDFVTGCTSWGDMAACFGLLGKPYAPNSLDLMFALSGTSTPVGPVYAGTPGRANCFGATISALSAAYGGDLSAAARALGFASVKALQQDIRKYCG